MADTYTWGVANLERHLADKAVYTVHWTVNAERTVGEDTFTTGAYGSIGLGEPDPQAGNRLTDLVQYSSPTPGCDERVPFLEFLV